MGHEQQGRALHKQINGSRHGTALYKRKSGKDQGISALEAYSIAIQVGQTGRHVGISICPAYSHHRTDLLRDTQPQS